MKFSDGFWLNKKGFNVHYAEQIYKVTTNGSSIIVHACDRMISHRAMALGGVVFTIIFSSPIENCIRVTIDHFTGKKIPAPSFELTFDDSFSPTVKKSSNGYELISGRTTLKIGEEGSEWSLAYYYDGKLLTKQGWRSCSYIEEEDWLTRQRADSMANERFYAKSEKCCGTWICDRLGLSVGEYIYGFGEKFTSFVKNGQTVDVWNNDGGTCSEQTYKSVPFFVSSNNYGIFVNHPEKVSFEVASDTVSKVSFAVEGEHLDYFIFGGANVGEIISRYTSLTGRPALPPAYSFGLWLSTSFTTNYDESTVTSFIDEMEKREIPLEVFHFDCFWMNEFQWCSFEWDKKMFPDPKGFISRLKQRGLKLCVWINPYVSQLSPTFDYGCEHNYFIKNKDGSVFQTDMWQPGLAIVDFTNPEAKEWFASKIRGLAELGIDTVKTDFGERIPTDVIYHDGSDPFAMHNYYSYLYNKTVWDALCEAKKTDSVCLFARSATAGCQKFPVHWGGDCFSNYESMYETLRGGLSLCLSGFGFFSHDISGFESKGTPDLYKRWTAFGLLSTHSRYHGSSSYRVPWSFDEESCDVTRHFTRLKGRLMPYLYSNAVRTHQTGIPMMRAMLIDFSYDRNALTVDTQYMLGESLLVAPVFSEDGGCSFYLPVGGTWTDILTGEELPGGSWFTRKYDYFGLPLYARPNSIIVFGNFKKSFEYDYTENMEIVVYGIDDGRTLETEIFDIKGKSAALISASRNGDDLIVTVNGTDKTFSVRSSQGLNIVLKEDL